MNWPDKFVEIIARRQCVLFLGAGLSMNSVDAAGNHPKGWKDFLLKGQERVEDANAKRLIKGEIQKGDYLLACELIKKSLGSEK